MPGDTRWLASGVTCAPGTTVDISASGTIQHDQTAGSTVGPDGLTEERYHKYNVEGLPDANTAGLIGGIDETDPFFIGSGVSYDCPRDGELTLGINDINLDGELRRVGGDDRGPTDLNRSRLAGLLAGPDPGRPVRSPQRMTRSSRWMTSRSYSGPSSRASSFVERPSRPGSSAEV